MTSYNIKTELTWHDFLIRGGVIIAVVAVIVWALPRDSHVAFSVEKGRPWTYADLQAPFDFPIYKSEEVVKLERDSIMKLYEPYYKYNKDVENNLLRQFSKDYKDGIPGLDEASFDLIVQRLHDIYRKGVMSNSEYADLRKDTMRTIRIIDGRNAVSMQITAVLGTIGAYEQLFNEPRLATHREILRKCNLNDYISPNLVYDEERSQQSLDELQSSIPLASGIAQRGQKIIDRGEIVDAKKYAIITSFQRELERQESNNQQMSLTIMGKILYVFILITLFTAYLTLFRRDYFENSRATAMLFVLIVLFVVAASVLVSHSMLHVYIIPFAMVPIFIRVFMDSRTAFMTHVTMLLLCACVLQHPLEFLAVELVAGIVAICSLRELSSRSQLFWTAMLVTASAAATHIALIWIREENMAQITYNEINYLVINGLLLFCSYPLLYLIEKAFGFTSNITLIELSDMNKELLRKMSEVAPGTFNHSIQVANLAGEIARKIGAKSQLVRTGALYHDIGKIQNPIYFTENQNRVNPHKSMTYIDSAQMIISHVTEGLKLADKYNLPQVIKDFITTHHGLGKAKYFYIQQKNAHPDEPLDDLLFTYPGPNPFTKEQAILMMADSVEAASRSLPDYTEKSIRELVNKLIDGQVAEGYFRECPITFRDIAYTKTVLIEKLKNIYHTRISYPELKQQ
ncbi:MAG: HDIG domain-containing protein [Prevotella sp.]|nr:HDIG domain-containing protein [Prevotella sp.]